MNTLKTAVLFFLRWDTPSFLNPQHANGTMAQRKRFVKALACTVRIVLLITLMAASAAAKPVWVLQSAQTNPNKERTRFDAGITPGYYEPRFAGTFMEAIVSQEQLGMKHKWVDHEQMELDVELTAKFKPPEKILKPGETIIFSVHFSNSGTVKIGNPGIRFSLRASDGTLKGPDGANYFPWDSKYAGPPPAEWYLTVPPARDGEFTIDASLLNIEAAWVRWTYRIEDRDLPIPPRDWVDLLPDYFRPPKRPIVSRGTIIEPRGTVEHYVAAFDKWVGPIRGNTPLHTGDRIRTGPNSDCRVVFRNPEGNQDTITVGADTLLEVPKVSEPELSIAAQLLIGLIKIKHAVLRQPGPPDSPFVVRTATIVIGTRGTEYAVSATADKTTKVFVKEGQVGVFAIPSKKLTEIGPGHKVTISPEGAAQVAQMGPNEYAGLLGSARFIDTAAVSHDSEEGPIAKGIPVPGAKIKSFRFYENGDDHPPFGKRTYAKTFPKSKARRISWEILYTHPAPGRRIEYKVTSIYFKVNGSRLSKYVSDAITDAEWVNTYTGASYGWAEPGHWEPGRYRVDVLFNEDYVTSSEFVITPD